MSLRIACNFKVHFRCMLNLFLLVYLPLDIIEYLILMDPLLFINVEMPDYCAAIKEKFNNHWEW